MFLLTSEQMQERDRHTITTLRVPGLVLMDHAGRAIAQAVGRGRPQRVTVVCGKGNNGGDGWACARWLHHWGIRVTVVSVIDPGQLQGEAAQAAEMAIASGVPYQVYSDGDPLPEADAFVDALLGTGTARPLAGTMRRLAEQINQQSPWTVAADVPTGVDASTGEVPSVAVRADVTVCLAAQKLGTAVTPGCLYAGRVEVADIGIPLDPAAPYAAWVQEEDVRRAIAPRRPESHKGSFGRVGVLAGPMPGAAVLAGLGAARAGAGLVVFGSQFPLPVPVPVEFVLRDALRADTWHGDCQAVVVGPGLGDRDADRERARRVIERHTGPGVIDADALPLALEAGRALDTWVLTPHPKECARLLGWTTDQVQASRLAAVRALAKRTGAVVVLKGYRSIIADALGRIRVNPTGHAALATAGTGDILAGIIGGLLAQGADPFTAACAGAWLHGRAGELAGEQVGSVSTMAADVVEHISRAISACFDTPSGG
ncbi:bifunctional ADP-dependent NAD(P)H-hydrate dehydratase/NAD(P)H-hydrate epimerase [Alicyclobacillus macrosporangiidus]|uniref:Bifunctional NAD(P)H-hydrate repair enzyme n=1 Tax=Alicyclobacillus macrosporangiidus TaxID=392015 RepID=A0A1I7KJ32_9BACL|nr:bifunctional ADP-dependent NAD(P)H-hydrate dehydratase/NAD(P)H-hydrate epimerase [Alicyclobacillus macrosporangiidus]SFU97437.1 NAD(P)H-hydrate epimerase [Alicyclobacillus macrosporangiidus]